MSIGIMESQPMTQKPAKLKASCDFCALSKLKCDRGHPQCRRCVKSGIPCHYSETRRVGKTRQIYAASHAQAASPTMQGESWAHQTSHSPLQSGSTGQRPSGRTRVPHNRTLTHEHPGSSDYAMSMNLFDNFLSQDAVPIASATDHLEPPQMNPYANKTENMIKAIPSPDSSNEYLQNFGGTEVEMGDTEYIHDPQLDNDQGWDLPASISSSSDGHAVGCIKRASTILQSLQAASTCTHSEDRPINTMNLDTTLKNNRRAMDTIGEILDCPCSHTMSVALLLVLIAHQGMESYQRLLTQLRSGARSPLDQHVNQDNSQSIANDVPIAIGGYLLDEEMRVKVSIQVICSELDRMSILLDTLAKYTEGMRKQPEETVLGTYIESVRKNRSNILLSIDN